MSTSCRFLQVRGRHLLLACVFVVLLALIVPMRALAVVGGKVLRANRYPGVVQVVANDFVGGQGTLCGGALIAPRVVVTAGHCFLHVPLKRLQPVSVVFGRQRLIRTRTLRRAFTSGLTGGARPD